MSNDILGKAVKKVVELPVQMLRPVCDLLEKMLGKEGWLWYDELKKFLRKEKTWTSVATDKILRLISGGEVLIIDGSDGSQVDDGTITWHFEDGCDKEGANEPCPPTVNVNVEVHEMVKDATFTKMFGSLSSDLQEVFFSSRDQVRIFANKHRKWFRKDAHTFIPYKSANGNLYVAGALVRGGGLDVRVRRFGRDCVWSGEYGRRLVVPKI
jgi:hypothetical protein